MRPFMTHKEFSSRGGKARAKKLTKAKRSEIARKAANARWKHKQMLKWLDELYKSSD